MPSLIALAAAVAVGLHVLIDALVAVEPGAERRDHLPALVVVGAVLVGGAVLWPRERAGVRAAGALVLGVLTLVGAGTGVADVAAGGPRGDAWSALVLLAPAGVALVGVGVWLLWCSRRRGGRWFVRRVAMAVAAAVVGFEVVLPVAIAIIATERPREEVGRLDLGRSAEAVTFETDDGLRLAASYVPSENGAAVVVFPSRRGTAEHARLLAGHGYGVLALDMRGYGESEGDANAFGWGAAADIDAAVAWLQARPEVDGARIGGLGLSVGGEVLLEAAAANPGLRAVVSDGAGERSVRESFIRGPSGWPVVPQQAVLTAAVAVLAGSTPPPSLEDVVARIAPRPVLLIEAERGAGGEELNPAYARAGGPATERWVVTDAGHTGGLDAQPAEYEARVIGFLGRALPAAGG